MKPLTQLLLGFFLLSLTATLFADNLWLDVRTPKEYQQGHVAKAQNIPHEQIVAGKVSIQAEKDDVIYVYCKSGNRANKAKNALKAQGFTEVINLGGLEQAKRFLQLNPEQ